MTNKPNWARADQQKARKEKLALNPDYAPHGSYSTYTNYGCRCEECREAKNAYRRRKYAEEKFSPWGG